MAVAPNQALQWTSAKRAATELFRSAAEVSGGAMPFGRCPVCGASYHMNVGLPVDEWYRRYWPGVPFGAEVPGECIRCWVPLRIGHQVTVRAVSESLAGSVAVGAAGVVAAVEPGAEPAFVVELAGAAGAGRFRRSELFWMPGQPPVPEASDA